MQLEQPVISESGNSVTLHSPGGPLRFHAIWLRDNANVSGESSAQKMATILDIPNKVTISHASADAEQLSVILEPEHIECHYSMQWLSANAYDHGKVQPADTPCYINPAAMLWDQSLEDHQPVASYHQIRTDEQALMHGLIVLIATALRDCQAWMPDPVNCSM